MRRLLHRLLRRKPVSRRHPNPEQAVEALRESHCLYSPISTCSGGPASEGLRDVDDTNAVLVCKAHYGRLRKMQPKDLDRLERVLRKAFRPDSPNGEGHDLWGGRPDVYAFEDEVA